MLFTLYYYFFSRIMLQDSGWHFTQPHTALMMPIFIRYVFHEKYYFLSIYPE